MSDETPEKPPASTVFSVRIDPQALAVLEWQARITGYPLRARLRDELEAQAEEISKRYDLPADGPPEPTPAGTFQPQKT